MPKLSSATYKPAINTIRYQGQQSLCAVAVSSSLKKSSHPRSQLGQHTFTSSDYQALHIHDGEAQLKKRTPIEVKRSPLSAAPLTASVLVDLCLLNYAETCTRPLAKKPHSSLPKKKSNLDLRYTAAHQELISLFEDSDCHESVEEKSVESPANKKEPAMQQMELCEKQISSFDNMQCFEIGLELLQLRMGHAASSIVVRNALSIHIAAMASKQASKAAIKGSEMKIPPGKVSAMIGYFEGFSKKISPIQAA